MAALYALLSLNSLHYIPSIAEMAKTLKKPADFLQEIARQVRYYPISLYDKLD